MTQATRIQEQELLRVLSKGMITIPKAWRDVFGFEKGGRVRARKLKNQIIIEPIRKSAPYRIYSQKELLRFLKDDQL